MRSRSLCATVTIAALAALTTAACSAAPSPAPGPTSHEASVTTEPVASEPPRSTPPVPTPTPMPTWPMAVALPSPPPEMSRDDEVGAVAAAEYFLELYTYTESSQDIGPWSAMSHSECIYCASVLGDVAAQASAGHITHSAPMVVTSRTVRKLNPLAYAITLNVTKEPEELWTLNGRFLAKGADLGGGMDLVLAWQGVGWIVREVSTFNPVTE